MSLLFLCCLLGCSLLTALHHSIVPLNSQTRKVYAIRPISQSRPIGLDSRGYGEFYQEISQILIKYPVTTGISQGMADGPTLRSKSTGRCNKRPAPFGTWNLEAYRATSIVHRSRVTRHYSGTRQWRLVIMLDFNSFPILST